MDVNQPPLHGRCEIDGRLEAFNVVKIRCYDWVDQQEPLQYNFELVQGNGQVPALRLFFLKGGMPLFPPK